MLYTQAVSSEALDLLTKIAHEKTLSDFRLAGGTALALQIGHRISYDLDFFCFCQTENKELIRRLSFLKPFRVLYDHESSLALNINNVKIDFVKYAYPFLEKPQMHDGIAMASLRDIAAMKIAAITGRGKRRDFVDLFFLLRTFTLQDILSFYSNKYDDGNEFMALRSLNYFADAEKDPEIVFLNEKPDWEFIKNDISIHVKKIAG